jgi:hypothetical protein
MAGRVARSAAFSDPETRDLRYWAAGSGGRRIPIRETSSLFCNNPGSPLDFRAWGPAWAGERWAGGHAVRMLPSCPFMPPPGGRPRGRLFHDHVLFTALFAGNNT